MNTAEELDIITRMRGEVMSRKDVTGENLYGHHTLYRVSCTDYME